MSNLKAKRADKTEKDLRKFIFAGRQQIKDISYFLTKDFLTPREARKREFSSCNVGLQWSRDKSSTTESRLEADIDLLNASDIPSGVSLGNNAWFKLKFEPENLKEHTTSLHFSVHGQSLPEMNPSQEDKSVVEALCYKNGEPWRSFDHGHRFLNLSEDDFSDNSYNLLIEVGNTLLWGGKKIEDFVLESAELVEVREEVRTLYLEYKIFNELRKELSAESVNRTKILDGLAQAGNVFPFDADDEDIIKKGTKKSLEILAPLKELKSEISDFKLWTVGHSHLDTAWLWPWSETIRKVGRTFSNALNLSKERPEFQFIQSQPHLYEFARTRYPKLFKKIKEKVREGSWDPIGGLWVESDTNIGGGEALARQYLYGKRYFREKFDVDPKITFIPDVFGYSASLPGISKAADCPYLFTQKMSWNEVNDFPHDTFIWEGIDGSQLLAHFPPSETYGGMTLEDPLEEVVKSAKDFKERDKLNDATYLIGWCDGGGGPNREMVDKVNKMDEIDALPNLEFRGLKSYFEEISQKDLDLERWVGELYLEKHRGTFTTQASTKKNNRELEFFLREAEIWASMALLLGVNYSYPRKKLEKAWKYLLFNQFHDILPGSSIHEVYEDAERDYREAFKNAEMVLREAQKTLINGERNFNGPPENVFVFNSLSWNMDRLVRISDPPQVEEQISFIDDKGNSRPAQKSAENGDLLFNAKDLPGLGGKTFKMSTRNRSPQNGLSVSENRLENSKIELQMGPEGYINSIWDKEADREVLSGKGNKLLLYRDIPTSSDAWDIEEDAFEVYEKLPQPENTRVVETGPVRGVVKQFRNFSNSRILQKLILYAGSKRIDFKTSISWKEENKLLKAHFPIDVHTNEATYEVQFGHYDRKTHSNTSWEKAMFEVSHQKWVDVSEYNYGAALLNNCKYGVNVDGSNIGLSLLRAPKYPDPEADMHDHEFTYSLLPHSGDFRSSGIIQEAYDLNTKPQVIQTGKEKKLHSLIDVKDEESIVIEAIKQSEDTRNAIVVRLYEAWGSHAQTELKFDFDVNEIIETNLIEDEKQKLKKENRKLELEFSPFEIKTLKVEFEN